MIGTHEGECKKGSWRRAAESDPRILCPMIQKSRAKILNCVWQCKS